MSTLAMVMRRASGAMVSATRRSSACSTTVKEQVRTILSHPLARFGRPVGVHLRYAHTSRDPRVTLQLIPDPCATNLEQTLDGEHLKGRTCDDGATEDSANSVAVIFVPLRSETSLEMKPLLQGAADTHRDPTLPKKILSHSVPTPRANLNLALSTLESSPQRMWQDLLPNEQWQDLTVQLAKPGATAMLYFDAEGLPERVLVVGMGPRPPSSQCTHGTAHVRDAVAASLAALRAHKISHARFFAPVGLEHEHGWAHRAAGEMARAVRLAEWRFDRHLSKERAPHRLVTATLTLPLGMDPEGEVRARHGLALAAGTNLARGLANRRGADCTPAAMERYARSIASETGFELECIKGDALVSEELRMLAAVGRAHADEEHGPRLIVLECNANHGLNCTTSSEGAGTAPGEDVDGGTLILVGKGVTFDTGGLNLKPTGSIEGMHLDMSGAAAVLGAAHVVGRLLADPDRNLNSRFSRVAFCIALAENAIGPEAYLPHEILKSHRGLTVSVGNTDAEGRLILADALSWTQARYSDVRAVVDVATLTGACVVALGEYAAGVFANDAGKSLATDLTVLGEEVGEVLHPLPILPGHRKEISEHEHADVCSTGATRWGGACTAAAFLERFIDEETPWAHMDIAGPGMASAERGVVSKGGTGFGAATLAAIVFAGRRT